MSKKVIFKIFLAIVLLGVIAVVVIWNKPHASVNGKDGMKLSAVQLVDSFINNEVGANKAYLNKIIEVKGAIAEISTNQDSNQVVLLQADDPLSGVQCTMKEPLNSKVGDSVSIKGFCNGYTIVVLLSDCIPHED